MSAAGKFGTKRDSLGYPGLGAPLIDDDLPATRIAIRAGAVYKARTLWTTTSVFPPTLPISILPALINA